MFPSPSSSVTSFDLMHLPLLGQGAHGLLHYNQVHYNQVHFTPIAVRAQCIAVVSNIETPAVMRVYTALRHARALQKISENSGDGVEAGTSVRAGF